MVCHLAKNACPLPLNELKFLICQTDSLIIEDGARGRRIDRIDRVIPHCISFLSAQIIGGNRFQYNSEFM